MLSQLNIKISLKLNHSFYLFFFIIFSLFSSLTNAQDQKFKVILDAGHGGKDPGTLGKASYKNSYESDIALKVALQVGKLLAKHPESYKAIYTRKTNVFIPLHKRGSIANKADADLFISIHCNAAVTNAYGTTTYVLGVGKSAKNLELSKRENDVILLEDDYEKHYDYDPNSEEFMIGLTLMQEDYQDKSIEFAQIVQNKFTSVANRKNRGVNQGNLAVLYDSYMPSVLIEIGFLSNKVEEKFLHTKTGQQKIAKAIYEAIKTYKKRLDNNSITPITGTSIDIEEDIVTNTNNANNSLEKVTSSESDIANSTYYYVIKIATSPKKITTNPNNFKKLKNIERIKTGSIYNYYYGKTIDLEAAKTLKKKVNKLGYKDAFIKRVLNPEKEEKVEEIIIPTPTNIQQEVVINQNTTPATNLDHYFSVQFATSRKKILIKPYNFRGLENVTRKKVGNIYKYLYGTASTLKQVKVIHKEIVNLGYKDAFIKKIKGSKPNSKVAVKATNSDSRIIQGIIFKVQVSSGKQKTETKAYNFRGLKDIERIKIGNFYKYYYGKTNDYTLINKLHKIAINKGYNDAKIVAIKNNKLVSISSVLNSN